MSKLALKTSKTTDFPDFRIGNISEAISSAFGNPLPIPKPSTSESGSKTKLANLKNKPIGKEFFLTEAEMNEIEEKIEEGRNARTYEEMIQEVDSLSNGLRSRKDDLEELRKRIARCQAGIETQEIQYQGLHKSAKEIKSQNKSLMKKFSSMALLPRNPEN